MNDLSNSVIS